MKRLIAAVALSALALPFAAAAQDNPTPAQVAKEKAMKDCFEKHGQIMEKPVLKNERDCWRVHGHQLAK